MRNLLGELRRRRVFRAAAWYGAAAWLAIQFADTTFTRFGLPEWTVRAVILACLAGAPVALALAWIFDFTPDGIRRTEPRPPGAPSPAPAWRGLSLWLGIAGGVLLGVGALQAWQLYRPAPSADGRHSIAVLPFASLTPDAESAGLTGGLHDVLITQLSRVAGLQVRSRTSVMKFQGWTQGLRPIADELGVALVLEGSVQRVGQRLVVNAQLIDARSDTHVWASTIDRTGEDLFGLQSEIARQVVDALRLTLSPAEQQAIQSSPTEDKLAYAMYLQARELRARAVVASGDEGDKLLLRAIARLEDAVGRDPQFALAWADLAVFHADIAWSSTRQDYLLHAKEARKAAERVLALRSGLPEAHFARGIVLMQLEWSYPAAAVELEQAARGLPSDGRARERLAAALVASGRWEEGLAWQRKAVALEPRDTELLGRLSAVCLALRDFACAREAARTIALLEPEVAQMAAAPAETEIAITGDVEPMRQWLLGPGAKLPASSPLFEQRWIAHVWDGDYEGALRTLADAPPETQAELTHLRGWTLLQLGRLSEARAAYEIQRRKLEEALSTPRDEWVEARARGRLAVNLAFSGMREAALEQAKRAEALYSYARDPGDGAEITLLVAMAWLIAGDSNAALDRLATLLRGRSLISAGQVWTGVLFIGLHQDPRFRALMTERGIDVSKEPFARLRKAASPAPPAPR